MWLMSSISPSVTPVESTPKTLRTIVSASISSCFLEVFQDKGEKLLFVPLLQGLARKAPAFVVQSPNEHRRR
jgi:hypothetical protein